MATGSRPGRLEVTALQWVGWFTEQIYPDR